MRKILWSIRQEEGTTMIEYIIVLPVIMIVLITFIMMCFVMHDRATLDGAAERGSIYAARCLSDPNYASILKESGNEAGKLDISPNVGTFSFSGIGKNIKPYRYVTGSNKTDVPALTEAEIKSIVESTRIPWRDIDIYNISVDMENKIYYQAVTVTLEVSYPLPKILEVIGLPASIDYTVVSTTLVNDPDELIRNADLVVDVIVWVDNRTGNKIGDMIAKANDIISNLSDKLSKYVNVGG